MGWNLTRTLAVVLAAALAVACGGEERAVPSGRSMTDTSAPTAIPTASNGAPVLSRVRLDPRRPTPGAVVTATAEASDPDGDQLHYRYEWTVDGHRVESRGPTLRLSGVGKGSSVEVRVVANDGRIDGDAATARVRVANRPPLVTGVRLEPATATVKLGTSIEAVVEAVDPDRDPLELHHEWRVNDRPVRRKGSSFTTAGLRRGDRISVRVAADDGSDRSEMTAGPTVVIGNEPPRIVSLPPDPAGDGSFRYTVEATDPDRDRTLRFGLKTAPEGMTIDPIVGEIVWEPTVEQAGVHKVEVVVKDPHGGEGSQLFEVSLHVSPPANAE